MSDESETSELRRRIAQLEDWLAAERERREAVEERLREARDELRRQEAEMAEMQKVNGQLRGRIAKGEGETHKPEQSNQKRGRRH